MPNNATLAAKAASESVNDVQTSSANQDLFAFQYEHAKKRAQQLQGNLIQGAAAFANEDQAVRRDMNETMFHVGDTFTIPADITSDQWISSPLSQGGRSVTRALVEGEDSSHVPFVKELFMGTLMKSVRNRESGADVSTQGTILNYTKGRVTRKDVWLALLGKTLIVTKATTVPIVRRGFNGEPDRLTDTTVLDFDVMD